MIDVATGRGVRFMPMAVSEVLLMDSLELRRRKKKAVDVRHLLGVLQTAREIKAGAWYQKRLSNHWWALNAQHRCPDGEGTVH